VDPPAADIPAADLSAERRGSRRAGPHRSLEQRPPYLKPLLRWVRQLRVCRRDIWRFALGGLVKTP